VCLSAQCFTRRRFLAFGKSREAGEPRGMRDHSSLMHYRINVLDKKANPVQGMRFTPYPEQVMG